MNALICIEMNNTTRRYFAYCSLLRLPKRAKSKANAIVVCTATSDIQRSQEES
jgi:hypothetical protein